MESKFKPIKSYDIGKENILKMYKDMLKIRYFENKITDLYSKGLMPGLAHLYIGEEAVAVGVCANLTKRDFAVSTHRGHGHLIAQGADLKKIMAEVLGKETGYCKGKGGSLHIMDINKGIIGAVGIVGAGIPIATGSAYSAKVRGTDQVTISFFGDAASNQGTFHESINMAAAWKLPVVYVCENNLYGISVDIRKVIATKDIAIRAKAYDIPGIVVDGNDILEVYRVSREAVERAREGEGPSLIECKTYRWKGHHVGDPGRAYRLEKETEEWKEHCPIKTFRGRLIKEKISSEEKLIFIEKDTKEMIKEAADFAIQSPYPDEKEAYEDLFVKEGGVEVR
ncbi:pyruvate dehydrogenase (acetyl-transferring) E1 component subunit alpha [Candidatus Atribacteria bacterium HGW-Atribacteria-1]|nr:MAG: pyruvate dehydrogenase (acetyl-transferring) E1 component subunit alpha [Candidatus Atribacteria bacterium HGW-Atribacteria-1]